MSRRYTKAGFNFLAIIALMGGFGCAVGTIVSESVENAPAKPESEAVSAPQVPPAAASPAAPDPVIGKWCAEIGEKIRRFHWPEDPCQVNQWKYWGNSTEGRPLIYADFGSADSANTTLVFAMVHGNEFTPLFVGLRLAKWLQDNMDVFPAARIVVVPLVNPDGFFRDPPTRVNAKGVDLNRNFDTKDWGPNALSNWKKKDRSDPRRFPGHEPESEIETKFQVELIRSVRPNKIISVHAPLNFLDYDGPSSTLSLNNFSEDYVRKCQELRSKIRASSGGFYPGSLGNYAGQERGIPTFTLELPTANPKLALDYWRRFKPGIRTVIDFRFPDVVSRKSAPPADAP